MRQHPTTLIAIKEQISMSIYTCDTCQKTFKSIYALNGHNRMHGISNGTISQIMCSCIYTKEVIAVKFLEKYQNSLKNCKHCFLKFKPGSKYQNFCSHSCGSVDGNRHRADNGFIVTEEQKLRMTKTQIENKIAKGQFRITRKNLKYLIVGEYSSVSYRKCCNCKKEFFAGKHHGKKCQACESINNRLVIEKNQKRTKYKFRFNIHNYEDLFNLKEIEQIGWYVAKKNPDGLSKDHKISVADSISNNYDEFYITHPVNCEIMSQKRNVQKNRKSSMLYDDLMVAVEEYEINRYMLIWLN